MFATVVGISDSRLLGLVTMFNIPDALAFSRWLSARSLKFCHVQLFSRRSVCVVQFEDNCKDQDMRLYPTRGIRPHHSLELLDRVPKQYTPLAMPLGIVQYVK